jgi:hypothetical protein
VGFKVREDQLDKVLHYIEEQLGDDDVRSIGVGRKVGKSNYRQVGEAFDRGELESLGTSESIFDSFLDTKCQGRGSWQLIAYRGTDADNKVRTQPVVRFETLADSVGERAQAGGATDHAIRDLSVQLRQNADTVSKRLDESIQRGAEQQDRLVELLLGQSNQERAQQDESAGTVLSLSIQLVETRMELRYARAEIERVQRDAASSLMGTLIEKMPPEAIQGAVLGLVGVVGELGQIAVDRLRSRPAPVPVAERVPEPVKRRRKAPKAPELAPVPEA